MTHLNEVEAFSNDIQSWIAKKSEHSCQLAADTFVVGANELAEFITQLTEKYKSQELTKSIQPRMNHGITLTCESLLEAFQYGAPDYSFEDEELTEDIKNQLSTEMTILWWENGHSGTGYYAYYTEYPEEGSIKLGDGNEH